MATREALSVGLAAVVERACRLCDAPDHDLVASFAAKFLGEIDDDELAARADDIAAATLALLHFGRVRRPGETLVEITPLPDRPHSLLSVITEDAPFMIDTIRLALERHGVAVDLMVHPWLDVERDAEGVMTAVGSGSNREAWTQMEISRCTPEVAAQLERDVRAGVADVQRVVGDEKAMRYRVHEVASGLSDAPAEGHTATEADQVSKLLGWLLKGHFVFLGAATYEMIDGQLRAADGSQLGLMRRSTAIDPPFAGGDAILSIARSDEEIDLHRHAREVCFAVRSIDAAGKVVGEERFLGLFAAAAYRASVTSIPLIRERRVAWVLQHSKLDPFSHSGRALRNVLETFPRDEIFEINRDELADVAMTIVGLQERSLVRVLALTSTVSGWQTLAVYLPRSRVTPEMPHRVARSVATSLGASRMEFDTFVSTSPLARVTVEIRRREPVDHDELTRLTREIDELTRRWDDRVRVALVDAVGEEEAQRLITQYGVELPADYMSLTTPDIAVLDATTIDHLLHSDDVTATAFVTVPGQPANERRLRIYRRNSPVTLSELLPLLDQMGLQAIDERPFSLRVEDDAISLYDVGVRFVDSARVAEETLDEVESTFKQLLAGTIESDGFNRLVLAAGLDARGVEIIRAYAKYIRQTSFPFSQQYVETTLAKYPHVAAKLLELFAARFDPSASDHGRDDRCETVQRELDELLEAVPSLDEDRICRTLGDVIVATLRTNAFRAADDGGKRNVIALKLDPTRVPDLPLPRPMFEIWVCSPRVEGVHLRGGRIARGGIRWSDRREDFRTEVLGLMKAQMVKNAVIVPVGAKGGFVVKRPPADGEALRREVVGCYSDFIAGLIDVTDNIVGGVTVPPPDTVRYDVDDPYLVVAADKGTATFSDIANDIAESRQFWLGDAFASGGSVGYDHKAMGITARGAWESVRRHAHALGRNADSDPLTAVGIGDMSGDVFGNGLLRSQKLLLLAAFDHRHIFLDPDPSPLEAFDERRRLFSMPRSSWADYEPSLISSGGGVFARTEKAIPISPQVRKRLDIDASEMTPNELISCILRAPVDLLWNGGVGTYVKAAGETNADVGDRANDSLRVNGGELRCRIVGEGGNLGFTQRGRVEYALAGGLIYTDAIDNSAGVDCSDHEVNIKIVLNGCVQRGELAIGERNDLLVDMTDDVAELVLDDNRAQTLTLALARKQAFAMINVHVRYLHTLESEGWLNRALEFLPTDRQLAERQASGIGLTTPEFAVLLAYTKNANVAEVLRSDLPDDPFLEQMLIDYFPRAMREAFPKQIAGHQLRREIIATEVTNQMVNLSGISFDHRITEQTGAGVADITRAWVVSRDITRLQQNWDEIEALGNDVKLEVQLDMLLEARRMAERGVLWLLRRRRPPLDLATTIDEFADPMQRLAVRYDGVLRGQLAARTHSTWASRLAAGVPESLAERSSVWPLLHTAFDVIDIAARHDVDMATVASLYWQMFDVLDVLWLWDGVGALPRSTRWETQARSALRDDLQTGLADLTEDVLRVGGDVATWMARNERSVARVTSMFNEVRRGETFDITTLTVGVRQLRNLALGTT